MSNAQKPTEKVDYHYWLDTPDSENIYLIEGQVTFRGWFVDSMGFAATSVKIVLSGKQYFCEVEPRADVNEAFPAIARNEQCYGFRITLPMHPGNTLMRIDAFTRSGDCLTLVERETVIVFALEPEEKIGLSYHEWIQRYDTLTDMDITGILEHIRSFSETPVFSVIMPVYNPEEVFLRDAIDSVLFQYYPFWELCIVNDASTESHVVEILDDYASCDERIKVIHRKENGHISRASNDGLKVAQGEFVALLDHDDLLSRHALYWMAFSVNENPNLKFIYSDEDKITEGNERYDPYFKPDWNPDLLLSQNYTCHFSVYRRSLLNEIQGFRVGYEGSQDWDLVLRFTELISSEEIYHIARILYHWRAVKGSTALAIGEKDYAIDAGRRAVKDSLVRRKIDADLVPQSRGYCYVKYPAISNSIRVVFVLWGETSIKCLLSRLSFLFQMQRSASCEVFVVGAGFRKENLANKLESDIFERIVFVEASELDERLVNSNSVLGFEGVFCFVHSSIALIDEAACEELLSHAARAGVGVVAPQILDAEKRVVHAGLVFDSKGQMASAFAGMPEGYEEGKGRLYLTQNYTFLSAACFSVKAADYAEIGGLGQELVSLESAAMLCFRNRERGRLNVYLAQVRFFADSPQICPSVRGEGCGPILDQAYNPNLSLRNIDFSCSDMPRLLKPWASYGEPNSLQTADRISRSDYKTTWLQLSESEHSAIKYVQGDVTEDEVFTEAEKTLSHFRETVGIRNNDTILEIGCGIGRVGKLLAPLCRKWIGCDVSLNMLEHARRRLEGLENIDLIEISGYDLSPIESSCLDFVYCTVVFMHLEEWDRYSYIAEAYRVLRPGGRIFVDNFNLMSDVGWQLFEQHRNTFPPLHRPSQISKSSTPQEIEAYLTRAGFRDIKIRLYGEWVQGYAVK